MVHPQGPAVPLARCRALGREGAAPPACGTQGTVCTRWTAGCKKSTELGGLRGQPLWLVCEAEGSDNSPSLNDKPRPRPQLTGLVPPHVSALHQLLGLVCAKGKDSCPRLALAPPTLTLQSSSRRLCSLPLPSPSLPVLLQRSLPQTLLGSGDISCLPLAPLSHPLGWSRPVPTLGRMPSRRPDATQCTPFPSLKSENAPGLEAAVHRGFQLFALQLSLQTCRR